jgi:hypothetical protein
MYQSTHEYGEFRYDAVSLHDLISFTPHPTAGGRVVSHWDWSRLHRSLIRATGGHSRIHNSINNHCQLRHWANNAGTAKPPSMPPVPRPAALGTILRHLWQALYVLLMLPSLIVRTGLSRIRIPLPITAQPRPLCIYRHLRAEAVLWPPCL